MADRDANGRFLPGHKLGGPGRGPRTKEEKYLNKFQNSVPLGRFGDVSEKLLEIALAGDVRAIKLLYAYAMGQPTARVEALVNQMSVSAEIKLALDAVYEDDGED